MSYNTETHAYAMAQDELERDLDAADAPVQLIYASLAECAVACFTDGKIRQGENILAALGYAIGKAREHVSKTTLENRMDYIMQDMDD